MLFLLHTPRVEHEFPEAFADPVNRTSRRLLFIFNRYMVNLPECIRANLKRVKRLNIGRKFTLNRVSVKRFILALSSSEPKIEIAFKRMRRIVGCFELR